MRSATPLLCVTVVLGAAQPLAAQGTAYEQLQAFSGVLSHVRMNYVDSVDFGSLVQASIQGMLSSLDPHSRYVTRREFELRSRWERGELAGVGLHLANTGPVVTVLAVKPDGPASKARVQPGDRVLRVNDTTVAGLNAEVVEFRLLGDKGSRVRLTLERGNPIAPDTLAVTLKRATLEQLVVGAPRIVGPQTGYIRLAEFTALSPKDLTKAIKKTRDMGARQLILDLRGNPGGDIEATIKIASLFLPARTEVFRTRSRRTTGSESVVTEEEGEFARLPLMVLIDDGSASASEILAGSLQDHDRALIVGRRSFGKALVQSSLPLPNGDVVVLTVARVITPSGRIIQRPYRGIGPGQYIEAAGREITGDSGRLYRTDRGRGVRGNGGILPDVVLPAPAQVPVWFSVAADSGYDAVADTAAQRLSPDPAARAAWMIDTVAWHRLLVTPFVARVQSGLGVPVTMDPRLRNRIALMLAARAAALRWGNETAEEFSIRNDEDIQAAAGYFPRLTELLGRSAGGT